MSDHDRDGQVDQKSSVKISTTAKGEPQVEVKVYDGTNPLELDRIRTLAVHTYLQTKGAVR